MDFQAAAREIGLWAGVLIGTGVLGVGIGHYGSRIRNWYQKKYGEPERKHFEGIERAKLPNSDDLKP